MRKSFIVTVFLCIMSIIPSIFVQAEFIDEQYWYWLSDTPSKYGFRGLYTLFDSETYEKGKFGIAAYWDMTRFCLPGDPRYPQVQEFSLAAAYGLTDRFEISFSIPFRHLSLPAASTENRASDDLALQEVSESGFSQVSLGMRYQLMDWLTPYLQVFLPTTSDAQKGLGAENTRIQLGLSMSTQLWDLWNTRLYGQLASQFATGYDQEERNFSEVDSNYSRPRFERFGANPLFHEYGNTLFYGAGFALPLVEDFVEIFSEFQFYHSFEDEEYIPMLEDGKALDVVQDGCMANVGGRIGFENGWTLTAGWGGVLFAEEPMYESPTWRTFAGLTYHQPHVIATGPIPYPDNEEEESLADLEEPEKAALGLDTFLIDDSMCYRELEMVHFEFESSRLSPEGTKALNRLGIYMRFCDATIIEIHGHTDWVGSENYNMGLANRRARAVVFYLIYEEGIEPTRIISSEKLAKGVLAGESYGESVPIASNETEQGRAMNRRVQFMKLVVR